jgi:hypothetical protein
MAGKADTYLKLAEIAAPLVIGAVAGKKNKTAANNAAAGSRLQDILPLLLPMMQQSQQHSAENYAAQQQKYQQGQPLSAAINSMAMNLLPNHVKAQSAPTGMAPQASLAPSAGPSPLPMPDIADLEAGYQRRGGGTGGMFKGAVNGAGMGASVAPFTGPAAPFVIGGGALVGAIHGAATKHAKSAPTDFLVADATKAIQDAIRTYQGREAAHEEVQQILQGQGWSPGDRYVGEQGLSSVLRSIQQGGR